MQEIEIKPHRLYRHTTYVMHVVYRKSISDRKLNLTGTMAFHNGKYRGLYICKCGNILNADVNGALNILKKVVPSPVMDRDRGYLNNPVRIKINYSN